ncbi:MAG: transcription antitermination factor NusB [Lachnospiraceae bacterium]|nr:transcription antitermination factor NusB [Lachnospiraceae bacterium]
MTRAKIRESIFRILFRAEFTDPEGFLEQINMGIEELGETASEEDEENITYIKDKLVNISEKIEHIDEIIEGHSDGWKLSRIGKAELAILRLSVFEMLYDDDIPVKVAINEAVELSKSYCDEDAKGFVNAILGKIERDDDVR